MFTIVDFLHSTRIVEVIPKPTEGLLPAFQERLSQMMPEVKFIVIRSVSADVFCLNFRGVHHIIWDQSYTESALQIASILLSEAGSSSVAEPVCFGIVADLLFDEGLYAEAWIVGTTAHIQNTHVGIENIDIQHKDASRKWAVANNSMMLFLFLHEVGHLLDDYQPEIAAELRDYVDNQVRAYSAALELSPPEKRAEILRGDVFITFGDGEWLDSLIASTATDPVLFREALADIFSTDSLFHWATEDPSCVVDVAEAVLAFRMAQEIIRDLRIRTRALAEGKHVTSPSSSEAIRGIILRHNVLRGIAEFDPDGEKGLFTDFQTRYQRLQDRRLSIFDELPEQIVTFCFDKANSFRRRMENWPKLISEDRDWLQDFKNSYLRLRGWTAPFSRVALDMIPELQAMLQKEFVRLLTDERIREAFDLVLDENGKPFLVRKSTKMA